MSYLDRSELAALGLRAFGDDVQISRKASIYGAERISIGNHVRVDDFCILSAGVGGIEIGSWVHIAAYTSLIGAGRIVLGDFSNLSSRVAVYSSSDDYSGRTMTNPTVPDVFKEIDQREVSIGRHTIVGCGTVILPGVNVGESAAIGALALVKADCAPFTIYAGNPARRIGVRERGHLAKEADLRGLTDPDRQ